MRITKRNDLKMNRNGKKTLCLLAAFILFTNSFITPVYAGGGG